MANASALQLLREVLRRAEGHFDVHAAVVRSARQQLRECGERRGGRQQQQRDAAARRAAPRGHAPPEERREAVQDPKVQRCEHEHKSGLPEDVVKYSFLSANPK